MADKRKNEKTKLTEGDKLRHPPVDIGFEFDIVRQCLRYGEKVIDDILDGAGFRPEFLTEPSLRLAFEVMLDLYESESPVGLTSLRSRLVELQHPVERINKVIADLGTEDPGSLGSAVYVAKELRGLHKLRELAKLNAIAFEQAYNREAKYQELSDTLEENLLDLMDEEERDGSELTDADILGAVDRIDEHIASKKRVTGLASGFFMFDDLLHGFRPGEQTILAARPGAGKTAMLLNWIESFVIRQGKCGLFFSLEMSKEALIDRLISMMSYVDSNRIRAGLLRKTASGNMGDWEAISLAASLLHDVKSRLFVDHRTSLSCAEIVSKVRRVNRRLKGGLDFVAIDYLQLVQEKNVAPGDSRNYELGYAARTLRSAIARGLGIPLIVLAQLNRGVETRSKKRPKLADLRDSGEIEQHADNVVFIHRPDYHEEDTQHAGLSELIVAKHRNGPTGIIQLAWVKKFSRFENIFRGGRLYG